ncbi:hypothetical protein L3Y34_012257 [Caenorhabditis briggsae]|uniref:Uncharacterized protein n=1 Tax=Caenorhabditis briggsae TaxID=6238 RepID=A0AAE8ZQX4_CAEBR|nr:hypothetical protein L3Y34_012257 [Caenorhabditis briggsae]
MYLESSSFGKWTTKSKFGHWPIDYYDIDWESLKEQTHLLLVYSIVEPLSINTRDSLSHQVHHALKYILSTMISLRRVPIASHLSTQTANPKLLQCKEQKFVSIEMGEHISSRCNG